jgi:hypothetical protein
LPVHAGPGRTRASFLLECRPVVTPVTSGDLRIPIPGRTPSGSGDPVPQAQTVGRPQGAGILSRIYGLTWDKGSVVATTDLVTWTCLGRAPPDVRSIGSLDGTLYFGGTAGRVYGFPSPSW